MIIEILDFNKKVIGIAPRQLAPMPAEELEHLVKAFDEEIDELQTAYSEDDFVGIVDSILDLCYFAIGGLYKCGLTAEQIHHCFQAIHAANMTKKRGSLAKRGNLENDAVKPDGWQSPEERIGQILFGGM